MAEDDSNLPRRRPERCIHLFGSLSLSFDAAAFAQVRSAVLEDDKHAWLVDVVRQLPQTLESILLEVASLHESSHVAREQLADLHGAVMGGRPLDMALPLPNSVLIPLVVIDQLSQYASFAREIGVQRGSRRDDWPRSNRDTQSLGLCTGILSAIAVSTARSWAEFQQNGAAAVRLGLLIGLVVDSQDAALGGGRWRSLSVAWSGKQGEEELQGILVDYEEVSSPLHPC
ncbi:predicted protein [Plenodomus lingam JN3]|uniref:Starter acyltransferase (SAT) domain-containing protein n=1 Tax=Leptosphaeria maculans (strain JN3 / isolate v23.1.3 / race Av1-4-5-6-7-8) TaxID=985895 RepID=E5A738_LEPMJ|nr:predicted protein [Plenodomus lingam JN3]CBX99433.1 predicted protein [Plenodomus lingam JN3]